jgi:hypothetical protein
MTGLAMCYRTFVIKASLPRMGVHASNVGVSLLAIAVCQPNKYQLTGRYREQAHSYRGFVVILGQV